MDVAARRCSRRNNAVLPLCCASELAGTTSRNMVPCWGGNSTPSRPGLHGQANVFASSGDVGNSCPTAPIIMSLYPGIPPLPQTAQEGEGDQEEEELLAAHGALQRSAVVAAAPCWLCVPARVRTCVCWSIREGVVVCVAEGGGRKERRLGLELWARPSGSMDTSQVSYTPPPKRKNEVTREHEYGVGRRKKRFR